MQSPSHLWLHLRWKDNFFLALVKNILFGNINVLGRSCWGNKKTTHWSEFNLTQPVKNQQWLCRKSVIRYRMVQLDLTKMQSFKSLIEESQYSSSSQIRWWSSGLRLPLSPVSHTKRSHDKIRKRTRRNTWPSHPETSCEIWNHRTTFGGRRTFFPGAETTSDPSFLFKEKVDSVSPLGGTNRPNTMCLWGWSCVDWQSCSGVSTGQASEPWKSE